MKHITDCSLLKLQLESMNLHVVMCFPPPSPPLEQPVPHPTLDVRGSVSSSSPQLVPALSIYLYSCDQDVFWVDFGGYSALNVPVILSERYLGLICNFSIVFPAVCVALCVVLKGFFWRSNSARKRSSSTFGHLNLTLVISQEKLPRNQSLFLY